jgi:hypothetical protein
MLRVVCDVTSSGDGFHGGCWMWRNARYSPGGVLVRHVGSGEPALRTSTSLFACLQFLPLKAEIRSAWYRLVVQVEVVMSTPFPPYSSVFLIFRKQFLSSVVFEAQTSQVQFHWPLKKFVCRQ